MNSRGAVSIRSFHDLMLAQKCLEMSQARERVLIGENDQLRAQLADLESRYEALLLQHSQCKPNGSQETEDAELVQRLNNIHLEQYDDDGLDKDGTSTTSTNRVMDKTESNSDEGMVEEILGVEDDDNRSGGGREDNSNKADQSISDRITSQTKSHLPLTVQPSINDESILASSSASTSPSKAPSSSLLQTVATRLSSTSALSSSSTVIDYLEWTELDDESAIINGSRNQGHDGFIFPGVQCVGMCAAACVQSYHIALAEWDRDKAFEPILVEGDRYYGESWCLNGSKTATKPGYIYTKQLKKRCTLFEVETIISFIESDPPLYGPRHDPCALLAHLTFLFSKSNHAIVIAGQKARAVIHQGGLFYLFDSHSIDPLGETVPDDQGRASIFSFFSVEKLTQKLYKMINSGHVSKVAAVVMESDDDEDGEKKSDLDAEQFSIDPIRVRFPKRPELDDVDHEEDLELAVYEEHNRIYLGQDERSSIQTHNPESVSLTNASASTSNEQQQQPPNQNMIYSEEMAEEEVDCDDDSGQQTGIVSTRTVMGNSTGPVIMEEFENEQIPTMMTQNPAVESLPNGSSSVSSISNEQRQQPNQILSNSVDLVVISSSQQPQLFGDHANSGEIELEEEVLEKEVLEMDDGSIGTAFGSSGTAYESTGGAHSPNRIGNEDDDEDTEIDEPYSTPPVLNAPPPSLPVHNNQRPVTRLAAKRALDQHQQPTVDPIPSRPAKRPRGRPSHRTSPSDTDNESSPQQVITLELQCSLCDCPVVIVKTNAELLQHLWEQHSIRPFRCQVKGCRESFDNSHILGDHLKQSHPSTKRWPCDNCERSYVSYNLLSSHNRDGHQLGLFVCSFPRCGFKGDCKKQVYSHYECTHNIRSTYECPHSGCNYQSNSVSNLKIHLRSHSGIKPYKCTWPGCNFTSSRKDNTLTHIRGQHCARSPNKARLNPSDYLEVLHDMLL